MTSELGEFKILTTDHFTVIGLDGGASKVRGAVVKISQADSGPIAHGCGDCYELVYADFSGYRTEFTPVPLANQLTQWQQNSPVLTSEEKRRGQTMVETAAGVIRELLASLEKTSVVIGIGMPGLKTADKRGIAVMANGPRLPLYLDDLTGCLQKMGIKLAAPIKQLGSDADYCGMGEQYSADGQFRQVATAYYLGVGTGIADAMKIAGSLLPMDQARDWIAKSWELQARRGLSFEKCVAMASLVAEYHRLKPQGSPQAVHAGEIFSRAVAGEVLAAKTIAQFADDLAELVYERIATLALGGSRAALVDHRRRAPDTHHPFLGGRWQKIVFGQRLGRLWANLEYRPLLQDCVEQALTRWLMELPPPVAASYLNNGRLRSDLLVASTLDEAPILGAGIAACLPAYSS